MSNGQMPSTTVRWLLHLQVYIISALPGSMRPNSIAIVCHTAAQSSNRSLT
jgi:hypothetical protein